MLLTAGAAEAFVLLARALGPGGRSSCTRSSPSRRPRCATRGTRSSGCCSTRRRLPAGPGAVPEDADLVVVGNPTNPTRCCTRRRPSRRWPGPAGSLVVDEAFVDAVPGEPESLAGRRDLPGLLVVRSLTKTWGLAGLRVGYVLGAGRAGRRAGRAAAALAGVHPGAGGAARVHRPGARSPRPAAAAARRAPGTGPRCWPRCRPASRSVGTPAASFVLLRARAARRVRDAAARAGLRGAPRRHLPRPGPATTCASPSGTRGPPVRSPACWLRSLPLNAVPEEFR